MSNACYCVCFDFLHLYQLLLLDKNRINITLKNFTCYIFISIVQQNLYAKLPVRGWLTVSLV